MSKEPTMPDLALRAAVRNALSALPAKRKASKAVLKSGLQALGFQPTEAQIDAAIEWNHERNFVDFVFNHDIEQDEWFLTERGRAKEGLK